jgi:hypothetical protein
MLSRGFLGGWGNILVVMVRIANPSLAVFLLSAALALVHCAANMSGTPPWSRLQKGAGEGGSLDLLPSWELPSSIFGGGGGILLV